MAMLFASFYIAGIDFIPLSSSTLSFLTGTDNGGRACMNITIIDDGAFEKNETFYVNVTVVERNIEIQRPDMVMVTIVDNDGMHPYCNLVLMFMRYFTSLVSHYDVWK